MEALQQPFMGFTHPHSKKWSKLEIFRRRNTYILLKSLSSSINENVPIHFDHLFIWVHYVQSQEIFSEQVWELTEDVNKDGWVDQGDMISFEVKVTHNGETTQSVSIENLLEDDGLELISGSVKSTNGIILKGDKEGDTTILIEDVALSAPWGYATITFSAKVISDPEIALAQISNHTSLITSIGTITSNSISLPRRTDYSLSQPRFSYSSIGILSAILILAIALTYKLKR